ncbi:F0F1 ATP synthase subunit gamma [Demequina capsici]|uniref:ATP synthase gamma chain n=1 Tax=Demequina capsici TaxID=3075620 RepID=A0AA96FC32_9MICO|nr:MULTISPECIES: F0F1 ATP synthase subunit gamma [unclassified Demequina]WNM23796.1 F0F1 ATP synthase subunit gamma [Demequina sp. OYTSA14]WNM26635.1 F0F1 ATP synthase subunit gamma [Demequina sp. PMTSA13]
MSGKQREYRGRIRSTQSLKKIFRAMELIAASRIGKARQRVGQAAPYTRAITRAISAVATHSSIDHPLTSERTDTNRVAMLVVTADRGMAGAYSANVLREAERLRERLESDGKEVVQYASGRRAVSYYKFRHRELAGQWDDGSDSPEFARAKEISEALYEAFRADADKGGVSEIHLVFTRFNSMVNQEPRVIRMLPIEVVEGVAGPGEEVEPLYDFEPGAEEVLDALLPRYIQSRIFTCLLQAAASELANRQRAMNTAVTNAEDIIRQYTRLANSARQAEITQEISEIVSGADALAAGS